MNKTVVENVRTETVKHKKTNKKKTSNKKVFFLMMSLIDNWE